MDKVSSNFTQGIYFVILKIHALCSLTNKVQKEYYHFLLMK